jgi:hypothetical protein
MDKQEIKNTSPISQLSRDYFLALGSMINLIESIDNNEPTRTRYLARRSFLHREVQHYDDFFNSNKYNVVINPSNKDSVDKINSIVDSINAYRLEGGTEYEVLQPLLSKITKIIQ